MKNKKKLSLISLPCALAILSSAIATSCANVNSTSQSTQTKSSNEANAGYHFVTFTAPTGVTLRGSTTIRVRDNTPFGLVNKPVATKSGEIFQCWLNASITPHTVMTDQTKITSDITLEPQFKPITQDYLYGGNTSLYTPYKTAGQDANPWKLRVGDSDVDVWNCSLVKEDSDEALGVSYLSISNGGDGDPAKGTVFWTNGITETISFRVKGVYNFINYYSDVITLNVNDSYTVKGGSTQMYGKSNELGSDGESNKWNLYKNDETSPIEDTDNPVALSLEGYQIDIPTTISIDNGNVNWSNLTQGTYTFKVKATYKSVDYYSNVITLIISDYTLLGGSTSLTGQAKTYGADTMQWRVEKDGKSSENVTYELIKEPDQDVLPTWIGTTVNDGKCTITWGATSQDNVAAGTYKFRLKATTDGQTIISDLIILSIANKYTVVGGNTTLNAIEGAQGSDLLKWALYENNELQTDSQYITYSIVDSATLEPKTIQGLSIVNYAPEEYDVGKVKWNEQLVQPYYGFSYKFRIKAVYNDDTKSYFAYSDIITLNVDKYQLTGGNEKLQGVYGTSGEDDQTWKVQKNYQDYDDGVSYSLSNLSELDQGHILLDDNSPKIKWDNQLSIGTHTFSINAKITFADTTSITISKSISLEIKSNVSYIEIIGPDEIISSTTSNQFTAKGYPAGASDSVTWSISGWSGDETISPSVNPNEGVVTCPYQPLGTTPSFKLKATSTIDPNVWTEKTIFVVEPWKDSSDIWCTDGTTKWYKFDSTSLYDDTKQISYTEINKTDAEDPVARASFTGLNIYIGEDLSIIENNFLVGCTSFNSIINFPGNSKLLMIGDEFLGDDNLEEGEDMSFNQPLSLPSSLIYIGDYFMENCVEFNQPLRLPDSIKTIGDSFMAGCKNFVGYIDLEDPNPDYNFALPANLTKIGNDFLSGCTSFNTNFTISEKVEKIGDDFMFNCDSMEGTITVNTDATNFSALGSLPFSFATTNEGADCYTTGITIAGPNAADLIARFGPLPDADIGVTDVYRNLKVAS